MSKDYGVAKRNRYVQYFAYTCCMQPYENLALVTHMMRQITDTTIAVERMTSGGSTAVYRVTYDSMVVYVRVLPEANASFEPEALVHRLLLARGLRVPGILFVEPFNPLLERSVMGTTPIAGQAIGYEHPPANAAALVRIAGRELAVLNGVEVQGFGWIRRDAEAAHALLGEYATHRKWLGDEFGPAFMTLDQYQVLLPRDMQAVREALAEAASLFASDHAVLAHGDFDPTHIYYQGDHYTGIIDFGEIRGTHPLYDLGHFAIGSSDLLPALLDGYSEVSPLPSDARRRIDLSALLIAARRIGRRVARGAGIFEPDLVAVQRLLSELEL